jgi:hypothetical protein
MTKDGALKFLNPRGMPVKRNAVVTAFNSKELVGYLLRQATRVGVRHDEVGESPLLSPSGSRVGLFGSGFS